MGEKKKMWLVLGAFKRLAVVVGNSQVETDLPEGNYYAPMFEDRAMAEEFAGGTHAVVAVDVYEDDDDDVEIKEVW